MDRAGLAQSHVTSLVTDCDVFCDNKFGHICDKECANPFEPKTKLLLAKRDSSVSLYKLARDSTPRD